MNLRSYLVYRELYPRWSDVLEWIPERHVKAVRHLADIGKICRVTGRAGEQRCEFRHDRILEHVLVRVLSGMLRDTAQNTDVLVDPFYMPFVGRALTTDAHAGALPHWVQDIAPHALLEAMRYLNTNDESSAEIVAAAKGWLDQAVRSPQTPPTMLFAAYRILASIDSPFVLEVTESLPDHRFLARARLANGDAAAGALEFANRGWFAFSVNDRGLDAILARACSRHREELVSQCRGILEQDDLDDPARIGALTLAGFIGDSRLSSAVRAGWDSAPHKRAVLVHALWAGCRCGAEDPGAVLGPMMSEWRSLSNDSDGSKRSERIDVAEELRFAMRRGVPEPVLRYLVQLADGNEALRWPITHLLQHVDDPNVVRFLVEQATEIKRRTRSQGSFSPWLMTLAEEWDPTQPSRGHRLAQASLSTLRSCWTSPDNEQLLKDTAFDLWVRAIDDLEVLRSIPPDHFGFSRALWRRARLGDLTAVPSVKAIVSDDKWWLQVITDIWSADFSGTVAHALADLRNDTPTDYSGGCTDNHYFLAHVLRDIPTESAEPFLVTHWSHLQYSRLFVQAALYIGTPQCVRLADEAIGKYPLGVAVLEHLGMFFGFRVQGLSHRLTMNHVERILPYVDQVDGLLLDDMADFCQQQGHRDWAESNLRPECERRRMKAADTDTPEQKCIERMCRDLFPSDAELLEQLDQFEEQAQYYGHLSHWCERFDRRQDDRGRRGRILEEWLASSPSLRRLQIVADAILEHGSRKDLGLLTRYAITGDPIEVERVIASARFGVMRRTLK